TTGTLYELYLLLICLDGKDIENSPLALQVVGISDPSLCRAFGPGLETPTTDEQTDFTIEIKDADGNLLTDKLSELTAKITGGSSADQNISDINGTKEAYIAKYKVPRGKELVR